MTVRGHISPEVRELIREGARSILTTQSEWLDELDDATRATNSVIAADPELTAAGSRTNRVNLLVWASANLRDPGERVAPHLGAEQEEIARALVRRGLDGHVLDGYRVGQNAAWRCWMRTAFTLTDDSVLLAELLDVTAGSIAMFVDDTIAAVEDIMRRERSESTGGPNAGRLDAVLTVVNGTQISQSRAEHCLGYRLSGEHVAAIVWSTRPDVDGGYLDDVANAVGHASESRPLIVSPSIATRWVWAATTTVDTDEVHKRAAHCPEIRVALGTLAAGLDGFRRSHLDALTTQRLLARLESTRQVATFDAVELVVLLTTDSVAADAFVHRTLGDLVSGGAALHEAVRTFIAEQHNASAAAERLYLHRNTLMRRLARAETLLPKRVRDNSINIALALEIVHWRSPDHFHKA
ncbi:PucR family transcriptional regulator (plasmid) [Rhodococcoides fascians A21d2]|uniref:PucR family transcriptional regulator n=1 Tax=Rhodococcoides fascians TaxID=1828 RepID=UPI000567CE4C|nr:PucR family transcriptional regulator [Rhodococcus fascians]QII03649.1 PucR family transcriptional regulator [Rhodococcus fascians A21d2]